MKTALIGASGFVGNNLLAQMTFTHCYNSKNIEEIRGEKFDLLVCAGAPAEKWLANLEPHADRQTLARLSTALTAVQASRVVLISTIDVYPHPRNVDEGARIDKSMLQPYGRHRLELEETISKNFSDVYILRLPGLFGRGIKKNAIFDLLNDNNVQLIDARATFQFYNLANLSRDINRCQSHNLHVVNINSEPLSVGEISRIAFGREFTNQLEKEPPSYDILSRFSSRWQGPPGYLYAKNEVLQDLTEFVQNYRSIKAEGCV